MTETELAHMLTAVPRGVAPLRGHLDRVNKSIVGNELSHDDVMRSLALLQCRAMVEIAAQLEGINARLADQ